MQTNLAYIESGMCSRYNFVYLPNGISILFNKHFVSA